VFSTDEMIAAFGLGQIGRSAARFDFAKLENLNGLYMRNASDARLVEAIEAILPELGPARGLGPTFTPEQRAKLLAAMPGLKERAKTLVELLDSAAYLYVARPLPLEPKAAALLDDAARLRLASVLTRIEPLQDWAGEALEAAVRDVAVAEGVKLGQVAQPLRAALTGKTTSPGLFDVMTVLGRDESLARIRDQAA